MHTSSGRLVGALCAVAFLASACTSSGAQPDDDPTTASPPVEATATPTPSATASSPSDAFAMPDPVTEEYVDRVVNAIYEEWGAITREILEEPADPTAITPVEMRERIAALFGGQYLQRRLEEADAVLRGDRTGLRDPTEFGALAFAVRRIIEATPECMVVIGDVSSVETATDPARVLAALSLTPDPSGDSASGWRIIDFVPNTRDGEPMDDEVMLEATLADFEGALDHVCEGDGQ